MIDESKQLCICGHTEGFHSGVSAAAITPQSRDWWCCTGNWKTGRHRCTCPRFRLAIALPSNFDHVEDSGTS
jgi:hypothetical protein